MKNDILNKISPSEALEILKQIAKTDKKLKKRIIELAEELFRNVDVEAVCDEVFDALDGIDVHELWDRAGPKTDGYTSLEDMALEMFEESLEPFLQELYRLFDLKMHQEAKLYCMGILKGIYQYEEDSGSEFKDWTTDVKEMKNFLSKECHNWHEWVKDQI